jgi:hypothetical protein
MAVRPSQPKNVLQATSASWARQPRHQLSNPQLLMCTMCVLLGTSALSGPRIQCHARTGISQGQQKLQRARSAPPVNSAPMVRQKNHAHKDRTAWKEPAAMCCHAHKGRTARELGLQTGMNALHATLASTAMMRVCWRRLATVLPGTFAQRVPTLLLLKRIAMMMVILLLLLGSVLSDITAQKALVPRLCVRLALMRRRQVLLSARLAQLDTSAKKAPLTLPVNRALLVGFASRLPSFKPSAQLALTAMPNV